ncbi:MAG: metal-dependent transcriptional regulator [Hominimerdicola sp.]
MEELTFSQKKYLFAIYQLGINQCSVKSTEIAKIVGVSKSSTASMTAKLCESGYLEKAYYGQVVLTEKGLSIAKNIYQKTMLISHFLQNQLSVPSEQAVKDAVSIALYVSENTVNQIINYFSF